MPDYPECEKLSAISDQSQAIGEFIDWLGTQSISLMTWREDLTDERPVGPECQARLRSALGGRAEYKDDCRPPHPVGSVYASGGVFYLSQHCTHWLDGGECCLCGKDHFYEVTGIKAWVSPGKNITELLAAYFEIDLARVEAEKRAMLDRCRQQAP